MLGVPLDINPTAQQAQPSYTRTAQDTPKMVREKRQALERYRLALTNAHRWEVVLDLADRWEKDGEEYQAGLIALAEWNYQRSLDKVTSLLIQQLVELSKMGHSGTGMFCCKLLATILI